MCALSAIDKQLLQEAADWAMTLFYDTPSESQVLAFEDWRKKSTAHDAAWKQAQKVLDTFEQVPKKISRQAIGSIERDQERRRVLKLLSLALMAAPATWLVTRHTDFQRWTADVATATGERKQLELPDGSLVVLNTRSALNIAFNGTTRRIRLAAGEVLITTHPDPSSPPRPFLVDTPYGVVRAIGTRFSVRIIDDDELGRVSVFDSAVEVVNRLGSSKTLQAGSQVDFTAASMSPVVRVEQSATLWERGMLLAKDMPLDDVVKELSRYRSGVLRCDPAVADLLVSGAISLADTDAALNLLENNLPVRISRVSPYWVTLKPRG
jgi:transmembrane sensor